MSHAIWQRRGERPSQPKTILELLDRVVVCPSSCWLFIGGDSGDGRGSGYGRILRPGTRRMMAAHRYVYETFIGPIPPGHDVDHKCRLWSPVFPHLCRRCLNPDHLEAVTPKENQRRKREANSLSIVPVQYVREPWIDPLSLEL